MQSLLSRKLLDAWNETWNSLSDQQQRLLPRDERPGVIFASTKGCIDDFIWNQSSETPNSENECDPFTPILDEFLALAKINTPNSL